MEYTLRDLLDIPRLQNLLDSVDRVRSMPTAIIDEQGNILTATAWQDICTKFHRVNSETQQQCIESDTRLELGREAADPHYIYRCPMGLVDTVTPIVIEGTHLGGVFTGQLFMESPDEARFIEQAHRYGFDEEQYLAAMRQVPCYSEAQINNNLTFVHGMTQMLAELGLRNMRLARAESNLTDSNEFLSIAQKSAHLGLWSWDADTGLMRGSPELHEMFGVDPETGISTLEEWRKIVHSDDWQKNLGSIEEALRGHIELNFEYRIIKPSGEVRWISSLGQTLYSELNKPIRMAGVCQDITDRKLSEELLRKSEARNRLILKNALDGMMLVDGQGHLVEVNDSYCRMSGYSERELLSMSVADLSSAGGPGDVSNHLLNGGVDGSDRLKTRHRRKDGSNFDVEINIQPVADEDGLSAVFLRNISESLRAEKEIRAREKRYRQLFHNLPGGYALHEIILDAQGKPCDYRFLDINYGFELATGLKASDVIGRTFREVLPGSEGFWIETYGEIALSGKASSFEHFSSELQKLFHVNAYSPEAGKFATIFTDVTDSRRAKSELLEAQAILQAAMDCSPAGIAIADAPDGKLRYVNDAGLLIRGSTREEVVNGIGIDQYVASWQILDFDGRPLNQDEVPLARALLYGESNSREFIIRRKDDDDRIVIADAAPIKGNAGEIIAAIVVFTDITSKKQDEQKLANSQLLLRSSIESQTDTLVHFIDCNYNYLYFNKLHSETMKQTYSADVAVGMNILECIASASERILVKEHYDRALSGESHSNIQASGTNEPTLYETYFNPLIDEHNQIIGVTALARDVSHRIKQAEEKAKLETQLLQAQKMESVGRLAGGVAHDFNNMLSVILGHAELGLLNLNAENPLREHFEEIHNAADSSADLVRQLLAFARKQVVIPQVIDLNDSITGITGFLKRLVGENVVLIWKPVANLWRIKLDPAQLDQILVNLCINARDAIEDAGSIFIEAANCTLDESYCLYHEDIMPGEYVKLSVRDDGKGMNQETITQIFDPFFTTKELGQGTGLGLSSVFGAIKQNKGSINVYSEPGMGTTFTVYLPRCESNTETKITITAESELSSTESATILLVEDEPGILDIATRILTQLGYHVLAAGSPDKAIQIANEYDGAIDVLITDVIMPGMNGKELAQTLASIYPAMHAIYMSGYTADIITQHGVLHEETHFIQKPFSRKSLAVKLREVLG